MKLEGIMLLLSLLVACAFLFSAIPSPAIDTSSQAIIEDQQSKPVEMFTANDVTVYLTDNCKITKGLCILEFIVENNTDGKIEIQVVQASVHDFQVNTSIENPEIEAGKKRKVRISLDLTDSDLTSLDELDACELVITGIDSYSGNELFTRGGEIELTVKQ